MGNISVKWQLIIICVLLVALPVITLGVLSFNNSKQTILDNTEEALKIQCINWSIVTQLYYDLIEENKRVAKDTTERIIVSQASKVSQLIQNHFKEDLITTALKEPFLRVRKNEKNMLLNIFSIDEFNMYAEQLDSAVKDIQKIINEAALKNIDTKSAKIALSEYIQKIDTIKLIKGQDIGAALSGEVDVAGGVLDKEFSKLAEELSDERWKELLASSVIGQTGYVYIIDYNGNYILSKGRKKDGERIWYAEDDEGQFVIQNVVKKGKALKEGDIERYAYSWKDTGETKYRKQLVAIMHVPMKKWVVGVVIYPDELLKSDFEEIKKEELKNLMAEQRFGKTGYLSIIGASGEQKGVYVLSKDRERDGENVLWEKDDRGSSFINEIVEDAQSLEGAKSRIKYYFGREPGARAERQKVLAYTYFKPWNWIIITSAYLDEFFGYIDSIRNWIVFICIIAIVLGSFIVYFFASIMTRTLNQLINKMSKVARGDLDVNMDDVRVLGDKNEVGQLANAFKQMTDNLYQTTFSKDYVDNIIGNMNDSLFVIDKDARIVTVNNAACRLINCTENEILKYHIASFFMSGEDGLKALKEKIFRGEIIENLEMELKDKKGNSIPVSINGAPLKDFDSKVTKAVLVTRDISEHKKLLSELSDARKNLEEKVGKLEKSDRAMLFMVEDLNKTAGELKEARNKLEEKVIEIERINKELDDFTYIVSHDLKEPLRGVRAFAKLIAEQYSDKFDKEGKESLKAILDSGARMTRLIEDLLNLSRIGKIRNIEPNVNLNELLLDVKKNLMYSLEDKHVDLKVAKDLPVVACDKIRISEVFSNLISNAVKYSKRDVAPVVEIGYVHKGLFYEFYVKDNGIGIEKEYYDKVFQIFQRLHAKGEYEGTGAGLTIVKKIVESHGGRIWVESVAGTGSTFYFTIPVAF